MDKGQDRGRDPEPDAGRPRHRLCRRHRLPDHPLRAVDAAFDITLLAREYRALGLTAPRDFLWVNLILAGFGIAALLLSVTLLGDALTRFGTTHWQTRGEMKRNGFFAKPGGGFLLGKLGPPKSKRPFLVSKTFPHALIVAPDGPGQGRGLRDPEPAHLQRLGRGARREGRELPRDLALPRQHGRQSVPVRADRLGPPDASLQPAGPHRGHDQPRPAADGTEAHRQALPADRQRKAERSSGRRHRPLRRGWPSGLRARRADHRRDLPHHRLGRRQAEGIPEARAWR